MELGIRKSSTKMSKTAKANAENGAGVFGLTIEEVDSIPADHNDPFEIVLKGNENKKDTKTEINKPFEFATTINSLVIQSEEKKSNCKARRKASSYNVTDIPNESVDKVNRINIKLRLIEEDEAEQGKRFTKAAAQLKELAQSVDLDDVDKTELKKQITRNAQQLAGISNAYLMKEKQLALVLSREEAMCTKLRRRLEEHQRQIVEYQDLTAEQVVRQTELRKTLTKSINSEQLNLKETRFKLLQEFSNISNSVEKSEKQTSGSAKALSSLQAWIERKQGDLEGEQEKSSPANASEQSSSETGEHDVLGLAMQTEKLRRQLARSIQDVESLRVSNGTKDNLITNLNDDIVRLTAEKKSMVSGSEISLLRVKISDLRQQCDMLHSVVYMCLQKMHEFFQESSTSIMSEVVVHIAESNIKLVAMERESAKHLKSYQAALSGSEQFNGELESTLRAVKKLSLIIPSDMSFNAAAYEEAVLNKLSLVKSSIIWKVQQLVSAFNKQTVDNEILKKAEAQSGQAATKLAEEVASLREHSRKHIEETSLLTQKISKLTSRVLTLEKEAENVVIEKPRLQQLSSGTPHSPKVSVVTSVVDDNDQQSPVVAETLYKLSLPFPKTSNSNNEQQFNDIRNICSSLLRGISKADNQSELQWIASKLHKIEDTVGDTNTQLTETKAEIHLICDLMQFLKDSGKIKDTVKEAEEVILIKMREKAVYRKEMWLRRVAKLRIQRKEVLVRLRAVIECEKEAAAKRGVSSEWIDIKLGIVEDAIAACDPGEPSSPRFDKYPVGNYGGNVQTWGSVVTSVHHIIPTDSNQPVKLIEESPAVVESVKASSRIAIRTMKKKRIMSQNKELLACSSEIGNIDRSPKALIECGTELLPEICAMIKTKRGIPPAISGSVTNNASAKGGVSSIEFSLPSELCHSQRKINPKFQQPSGQLTVIAAQPMLSSSALPLVDAIPRRESISDYSLHRAEAVFFAQKMRERKNSNPVTTPSSDLIPKSFNTQTTLNISPPCSSLCFSLTSLR